MSSAPRTTATILTPPGRGAVATISIEGRAAVELVEQHFIAASRKRLSELPLRRIVFGRWQSAGDSSEELVVCRLAEDRVEVHCHGGQAALNAIMDSLVSRGAVRHSPADWAFQHEVELIAGEARLALPEAQTERVALILLDQYQGAMQREIASICKAVIDAQRLGKGLAEVMQHCAELLSRWEVGRHLTTPWRVVLAGPPNVGKSSLMNALMGYDRSIVFDQPGTTRDVVTALTALEGLPVELSDTAGLREGTDEIEQSGVALTRQQLESADLVLAISDVTSVDPNPSLATSKPILKVLNKIDLGSPTTIEMDVIPVSARTGEGMEALIGAAVARLVPVPPERGQAVPFTERQAMLLSEAQRALDCNDAAAALEHLIALGQRRGAVLQ